MATAIRSSLEIETEEVIPTLTVMGVEELIVSCLRSDAKPSGKWIRELGGRINSINAAIHPLIGAEMISSIQGNKKGRLKLAKLGGLRSRRTVKISKRGKLLGEKATKPFKSGKDRYQYKREVGSESYECGILRQKSPDGKKYRRISQMTHAFRQIKYAQGKIQPNEYTSRDAKLRLLESGKHIFDAMDSHGAVNDGRLTVEVFFPNQENAKIAELHHSGGEIPHWTKDSELVKTIRELMSHFDDARDVSLANINPEIMKILGKVRFKKSTSEAGYDQMFKMRERLGRKKGRRAAAKALREGKIKSSHKLTGGEEQSRVTKSFDEGVWGSKGVRTKRREAAKKLKQGRKKGTLSKKETKTLENAIKRLDANLRTIKTAQQELYTRGFLSPSLAKRCVGILGYHVNPKRMKGEKGFMARVGKAEIMRLFGESSHTAKSVSKIFSILDFMTFTLLSS